MKYKMMVDEGFTDKLNEKFIYQPGDIIKTKIDEKRKEDLVARKLAHVVEETTDKGKDKDKKEKIVEPPVIEPPTTGDNEPTTGDEE